MNEIEKGLVIGLLIIMAVEIIRCNWRVSRLIDQINHNWEVQHEYNNDIRDALIETDPDLGKHLPQFGLEKVDLGTTKK